MGRNSHYFVDRDLRAKKAREHIRDVESKYISEIKECIRETKMYDASIDVSDTDRGYEPVSIYVTPQDSVTAILDNYEEGSKMAVLNFASFTEPGGKFLEGSSAQEESLCHESTLYCVLVCRGLYYSDNKFYYKNKHLYSDRSLYSPDVIFERDGAVVKCDVITCAAPNYYAAKKYNNVTFHQNFDALYRRINHVLNVAEYNNVDTLILGAYGCGVFGQDPRVVALVFKHILTEMPTYNFKKVVFAIPNSKSENYLAFEDCFRDIK